MIAPQQVDNYEYEMPSDFEDEEIDEEMAFTEEDKKKYAGWFDDEGAGGSEDEEEGEEEGSSDADMNLLDSDQELEVRELGQPGSCGVMHGLRAAAVVAHSASNPCAAMALKLQYTYAVHAGKG